MLLNYSFQNAPLGPYSMYRQTLNETNFINIAEIMGATTLEAVTIEVRASIPTHLSLLKRML